MRRRKNKGEDTISIVTRNETFNCLSSDELNDRIK